MCNMLTPKKKLYAAARLSGLNQSQSAIAAGYSAATAAPAASRLEKDPEVREHMARLLAAGGRLPEDSAPEPEPVSVQSPQSEGGGYAVEAADAPLHPEPEPAPETDPQPSHEPPAARVNPSRASKPLPPPMDRPLITATDPLEFMLKLMADVGEDPKTRLEAAKAAIPYLHAKKGEVGKKEEKRTAAEKVKEGRFGLRAVK